MNVDISQVVFGTCFLQGPSQGHFVTAFGGRASGSSTWKMCHLVRGARKHPVIGNKIT